jgi:hypothetical protein
MAKKSKKQKKMKDQQNGVPSALRSGAGDPEKPNRQHHPFRADGTHKSHGSNAQIKWICDMLDGKVLEASSVFAARVADLSPKQTRKFVEKLKEQLPDMSYDGINQMIAALKVLPNKQPAGGEARVPEPHRQDAKPDARVRVKYENVTTDNGVKRMGRIVMPTGELVLAGSYGIKTKDDARFANDVSFFKIWVGDRGGWNVNLYVSDDLNRVQLSLDTKLDVLRKIAKNPAKAASRFGWEFGRCGICGRGLTADESRERGIGPVCAGRL